MSTFNRISNAANYYQGEYKRVLCVCSAGLLRSPTTALVLSQEPYNYNTRAVGLNKEFALIAVDDVLLHWADLIVCMEVSQKKDIDKKLKKLGINKKVINLALPDNFPYRDKELIELIKVKFNANKE